MPYRIEYSADAEGHLQSLTARQQSTVLATVKKQLRHQATVETRNRKPMRPNPIAAWELRIGNLRVYYRVVGNPEPTEDDEEPPEPVVVVVAVGVKHRNRVRIGGEVVDL